MISEVLDFWFEPEHQSSWFEVSAAFDEACTQKFAKACEEAGDGLHDRWLADADGALALILLTDQLPRNIWRGTPRAFAFDAKARAIAETSLAMQHDRHVAAERRFFFYMPFEHSEAIEDQERSLALFAALGDAKLSDYARRHHDIIARFGRFPHRNAILGRTTTDEEHAFLSGPNSSF